MIQPARRCPILWLLVLCVVSAVAVTAARSAHEPPPLVALGSSGGECASGEASIRVDDEHFCTVALGNVSFEVAAAWSVDPEDEARYLSPNGEGSLSISQLPATAGDPRQVLAARVALYQQAAAVSGLRAEEVADIDQTGLAVPGASAGAFAAITHEDSTGGRWASLILAVTCGDRTTIITVNVTAQFLSGFLQQAVRPLISLRCLP